MPVKTRPRASTKIIARIACSWVMPGKRASTSGSWKLRAW
jgi:hypothetical protein